MPPAPYIPAVLALSGAPVEVAVGPSVGETVGVRVGTRVGTSDGCVELYALAPVGSSEGARVLGARLGEAVVLGAAVAGSAPSSMAVKPAAPTEPSDANTTRTVERIGTGGGSRVPVSRAITVPLLTSVTVKKSYASSRAKSTNVRASGAASARMVHAHWTIEA
jgi:hypothetical protein